ncbi:MULTISPECIES: restriction endonuclease subunit S [Rodentibacter]|uniref:restriction endonuclease subunit S n=1 Tax=Rodentibacter TaxID=1960084 RepID=UPI001CFE15E3|nr:restriction endonuclease subunit S [Rodentibacter sp. JRC1]GJI55170.1 putative type-1 restriction enzyme HindVIIP specificity protein [Rodentibacter sp. JRC1]
MAFNITEINFNIPDNWSLVKLSDLAKVNPDTLTKKDNFKEICYIDISSVSSHFYEKPKLISINDAPSRAKRKLKNNDIIISTVRPNLKQYALLTGVEDNWIASTGFCVIRANNENLAWYLYSLITSEIFTNYLIQIADGAAYPAFNSKEIEDAVIPLPNENVLNSIVKLARNFYKKIELNTQTNQTLEQIAQAIFKSWFIDFDPVKAKAQAIAEGKTEPDITLAVMQAISGKTTEELTALPPTQYQTLHQLAKAMPSEIGENGVPVGWEYFRADDLFDVAIGKTPPRKEPEWFSEEPKNVQWISIKDMGASGVFITKSSEYLTNEAVNKFNVKRIPNNTVILSFKLTVGRVSITTSETTTNEAIAHFKCSNKSNLTSEFLYLYLKTYDFNSLGSTSSIATAVNSKMVKDILVLLPNKEVIDFFQEKVTPIFEMIKNNTFENEVLEKARDELLPKLLSGEVGV